MRGTTPVALDAIVARALAKARADRFPSMAHFRDALLSHSVRAGVSEEPTPPATASAELWPGARAVGPTTVTPTRGLVIPRRRTIAVLPFANLSVDSENEYFSDEIGRAHV